MFIAHFRMDTNYEDNGMDPYQTLMEKAKKGFRALDVPDSLVADA
ncbi:hypothetical protein [Desulfosarcina cetonica]|nr:hypothetical protein [Desulfosarcina cetonica]